MSEETLKAIRTLIAASEKATQYLDTDSNVQLDVYREIADAIERLRSLLNV